MAEPTLGEILNFNVDPELGGGSPAVAIDNRPLINTLNENSRFQAENTWKKYNAFQKNLSDLYENIGDIDKMDVATADKEKLAKDRADLFGEIYKSPKEFFGSGNVKRRMEIEAKLGKLRSDATESKLNRVYDLHNRDFIAQNPELNTDENKQMVDGYFKSPLGQRKSYILDMPTILDVGALSKGILDSKGVSRQDFSYNDTPNKDFVQELSTTTLDHNAFKQRWKTAFDLGQDKNGHSIQSWAKQQYDASVKKDPTFKDKVKSPEELWDILGDQIFGSKEDIKIKETGKLVPNWRQKQEEQYRDRLGAMSIKFGYDKVLASMRNGLRETFELFKQEHGMGKASSGKALNDVTVSYIKDAQTRGTAYKNSEGNNEYITNWPPDIQKLFEKEGSGVLKKKAEPTSITVDDDGNIHTYYKDSKLNEVIAPDGFKGMIADKHHLTNALETSNEDLLKQFGTPSLNSNVNNYWDERTKDYEEPSKAGSSAGGAAKKTDKKSSTKKTPKVVVPGL